MNDHSDSDATPLSASEQEIFDSLTASMRTSRSFGDVMLERLSLSPTQRSGVAAVAVAVSKAVRRAAS